MWYCVFRYKEREIIKFFENLRSLGRRLPPQDRPPNIVLWLDSGLKKLWYEGPIPSDHMALPSTRN